MEILRFWIRKTLLMISAGVVAAVGFAAEAPADPASSDPAVVDASYPPSMESLRIPTAGGAQLNAIIYRAGGPGRHPVVVMFHGYPGNEKNLDLAQVLRRAGYHVVWLNYRGSWGSGGDFTLGNGLEDARRVLAFVRSAVAAEKYGFDPSRIAVLGHSYGGWVALMIAAEDPAIRTVVTLAAWNPVIDLQQAGGDPAKRAKLVESLDGDFDAGNGPLRGGNGEAIVREVEQHRMDYNYFLRADTLKAKSLLVIAAIRDPDQPLPEYHEPLVKALAAAHAAHLETLLYDDDHPFSAHRIALARKVTTWLQTAFPPEASLDK
jgi:pimeloyl-ACP methyl ester carboxylesterase